MTILRAALEEIYQRIVADVLGFIGELDDADTKALADLARQLRWLP